MSESDRAISRRQFIGTALASSAALMGLPKFSLGESSKRPPNFVVILCDDLGYSDLGCFGSPLIKTPRIDKMASEGMKLTSFYTQPVCTPSRAALLTGCYPMRVSLPNVLGPLSKDGINDYELTIANLLKTRGYTTGCIGKWHLGRPAQFLPTHHGFDYYYGLPYSNDMGKTEKGQPPVPLIRNEEVIEQPVNQDTLTQRYTQEAIKFITANQDRPFFLYLPHTFPHVPLHASDAFRGRSKRGLYGDVVEEIDWSTGQILDTLSKLGLEDNTMVVFTSDNGPWLIQGENGGSALPLRDGKATTYEGGVRDAFIARWPGRVPAGSSCSEMASEMDLLPTICRLAGARVPADRIIDGKDIWPLISGEKGAETPHDVLFYYRGKTLECVRSGKYKLVLAQEKRPRALYDLEADISETTDLSARFPKLVEKLEALAEQCREDLGDAATERKGKNCRPAGLAK